MTPTNRCLDGETLAAWVDGGLSRPDAAMAEAHVSTCPRCQEIAGLIVKTTPAAIVDPPWWRRRAAWLIPATVGIMAAGLLMIPPADPILAPAAPVVTAPSTATTESPPKADTPVPPAVAPPAEAAQTTLADAKKEGKREERAATAAGVAAAPAPPPPVAASSPAVTSESVAQERARRSVAVDQLARQSSAEPAKAAVSPDGAVHWRITDLGALQRSTDGGKSWQAMNVEVTATFTAVQAPERRTAVVTSTDGRVFRSTDGGATWQLVPPKL